MSQGAIIIPTTPPLPGATLVADLNTAFAAIASMNSGTAAPTLGPGAGSALVNGQLWLDTSAGATANKVKVYDGTSWLSFLNINTTAHTVNIELGGQPMLRYVATANFFVGSAGNTTLSGVNNSAIGTGMTLLTSGGANVALGSAASNSITSGSSNMALGNAALFYNQTGSNNVAVGTSACQGAVGVSIGQCIGIGTNSLVKVQADYNVGIGYAAGSLITTGPYNVMIGSGAGLYDNAGTTTTNITGQGNITIGSLNNMVYDHTLSNQLNIGNLILGTGLAGSNTLATTGTVTIVSTVAATSNSAAAFVVSGGVGVGGALWIGSFFARTPPVTEASTSHTVTSTETDIIFNSTALATITLPTAATYPGRELYVRNAKANVLQSAAANVVLPGSTAASSAILSAAAGKWGRLVSDGSLWQMMAGST